MVHTNIIKWRNFDLSILSEVMKTLNDVSDLMKTLNQRQWPEWVGEVTH